MSQHVLLTLSSTFTTCDCFEKITLFYNILQSLVEINVSMTLYDVLQK